MKACGQRLIPRHDRLLRISQLLKKAEQYRIAIILVGVNTTLIPFHEAIPTDGIRQEIHSEAHVLE